MISVKGVLAYFLAPILLKIDREPTREGLIDIHQLVRGNLVYVASNLRGGQHIHLALTMTAKEYRAQTRFVFVPPHSPDNYP